MTDTRYVSVKDVSTSNIVPAFDTPTTLSNGSKTMKMNYIYPDKAVEPLQIVTPIVTLPFGLSHYQQSGRWSCDVDFYGMDGTPEKPGNKLLRMLYDKCMAMDEYLLDLVEKNQEAWFGSKKARVVLSDRMVTLARDSNPPGAYAPKLKVHANPVQDAFQFKVLYNTGGMAGGTTEVECTPANAESIVPKRTRAVLLISFPSIWFTSNSFGWSCRVRQILVFPKQTIVSQPVLANITYDSEGNLIETQHQMDVEVEG